MGIKIFAAPAFALVLLGGALGLQQHISSQMASRVEQEMPKASGISASVPFAC